MLASNVQNSLNFVSTHCRFYNCYGRAECSGTAIQYMATGNNDEAEVLPIGRPIPNVQIHLLDEYLQPTIPGVHSGEIVIGGNI